jgi:hypothetical protein
VKQLFVIMPEWLKDWVQVMLVFACAHFVYDVAKVLLKFMYGVIIALLALSISGCSRLTPEAQKLIAERSVNLTVWGIYCVPEACGIGYIQYQRNPDENLQPAKPPSSTLFMP